MSNSTLHDDLGAFLGRAILPPGWRVVHEPSVTSTNDLAREAARRGWPDRSVFVADYQTAGRGRQSRAWVAPPRSGLLMSLLLRRGRMPPHAFTMLGSVALCETIEHLVGLEPAIKWPNDVMLDGRKAAGILAEATDDGTERTVVVGIGVNVNLDAETVVALPNATSLSIAAGWPIHRGELLVLLLEQFDGWLKLPAERLVGALWPAWEERLWGKSQSVAVREAGEEIRGVILGADQDGVLRLLSEDGVERRIVAGEILP
jgi:BirA family transcriptional regulator, biotin operon repressor / biotin---[acetyl-CoA-carboxylase] ligase